MGKRLLEGLLIVAILLGTLYTLTGCGNDSKDNKSMGIHKNDETVTTLYARLYGDGKGNSTLILSGTDYVDSERKSQDEDNFVDFGNVYSISGQPWEEYNDIITKVIIKDKIQPINTESWFELCRYLREIENINYLDTSNVTNMKNMFYQCRSLKSIDVSNFDTSNVTNMKNMFCECMSLKSIDVSNFNTSNVTDMNGMFYLCTELTSIDVSNFDTSNVTDMTGMFGSCGKLTSIDLSNFDTSNVTSMFAMFHSCSSLIGLNVSNFNTSNVTTMGEMFSYCSNLTSLDLSNFDTSNVISMDKMFFKCSNLSKIYASDKFTIKKQYTQTDMFEGCTILKGGNNTPYSSSYTDQTYARIDTDSEPGYFTRK